ncbi:14896_t:CDS:1, partial [Dentiscutata heterogama]
GELAMFNISRWFHTSINQADCSSKGFAFTAKMQDSLGWIGSVAKTGKCSHNA